MTFDCAHAIDAGPWVLGALADDEATDFAIHLRGCEVCQTEVARLQPVADVLPMAAEQVDPPPALRAAVMDVVRREAARQELGKGAARGARWWRWSPRRVAAVAGACLAVGAVAGAALFSGGGDGGRARTVGVQALVGSVSGSLVVDRGHARLHVENLPQPPSGKVYEVWKQRPGHAPEPTDALFTVSRSGSASVDVPGGVEGVEQVMVTAEPAGGSTTPTGEPVLSAKPA